VLSFLQEEENVCLVLLSVLVPALVLLVLLVEALGPLFILVDDAISVLVNIFPVMAFTGTQKKG